MSVSLNFHIEPLPEEAWKGHSRAAAFEDLYKACYPQLVDLCRRLLRGHGDPEAVAQDAFVRAWTSLDRFSGSRPFWPWVSTIARRLCIDQYRRLDRELANVHMVATAERSSASVTPDEILEAAEDSRTAVLAWRRLKPSERRVIALRDVNGWSYDQIAQFEGVTVESVRGSLKRARSRLRQCYARVNGGVHAVACLPGLRAVRDRVRRAASGAHATASQAAFPVSLAGDVIVGAVAVVLGVAGVVPTHDNDGGRPTGPTTAASTPAVSRFLGADQASTSARDDAGAHSGPDAPAAGRAAGPGGGTMSGVALPPDGGGTPEDSSFIDLTASPAYGSDGTVFASGTVTQGCAYIVCPVLFRSTDRGRSWHRLAATGFQGGNVLLPPAFPADNRIFVAGPTGLLVSDDGGESFLRLAGVTGGAAISPAFSSGDPRILFGATPGWEYRDDLRATKPGGVVLPSTSLSGTVAFPPTYPADPRILVGGTTVAGANRSASAVFVCDEDVCRAGFVLPGYTGSAAVLVSPRFHLDRTVVAWRGAGLFLSSDGGDSFAPVPLPAGEEVSDVAFEDGSMLLVTRSGARTDLFRTADRGQTWQRLTERVPATAVGTVRTLPDGRILLAVAPEAGGGLLCSSDRGITWRPRCG